MSQRYRVAQLGLGHRGVIHAEAFLSQPDRFEVVGLCELSPERLRAFAQAKTLDAGRCFADAESMLRATRPDVFCFVTQPSVSRLGFTEMAARHGVKAVAMEKPMALSLPEAAGIVGVCRKHGIKGVVSHQQKYLTSLQRVKQIVDAGDIGEVSLITANCQAWLSQLGTHFVDYAMWVNGFAKAEWVVGHVHGTELLADVHHPSPNYTMGQIGFANGVRAVVEFGKLSKSHLPPEKFWVDNRLTVHGAKGHVWGETDGRWGALINGRVVEEQGQDWDTQQRSRLQSLYVSELADWLDGKVPDHSCGVEHAYDGYEIMEALCLSAMDRVRVDLPLAAGKRGDMFVRMRKELPACPERKS